MATRNPPWTRDELILALDLYMTDPLFQPGKNSPEILELSETLSELGTMLGAGGDKYRNANGVYMKLMNFRRFDSRFAAAGKVGLTRGNKIEEEVWKDFADDQKRLRATSSAIRASINTKEVDVSNGAADDDDVTEAQEGRILTTVHRKRERSRKLVEQRKKKAIKDDGCLLCEACGFDFEQVYGNRGQGFIECHHTKPVHTLTPNSKTRLSDLALVCSNCHRMVHAGRPWLSMDELRRLLRNTKAPA